MRHRVSGKKLGRDTAHRKALLRGLSISLVENGSITTTLAKAKFVKPFFEKLVTRARSNNQLAVRDLRSKLHNEEAIRRLLGEIAPMFAKRTGGYTRIVKLSNRYGDNAPMARLELVQVKQVKEKPVKEVKGAEVVEEKEKPTAKATPKKKSVANPKPTTKKASEGKSNAN